MSIFHPRFRDLSLAVFCSLVVIAQVSLAKDEEILRNPSGRVDDFLSKHCIDCHNASDASGGLNLEAINATSLTLASTQADTSVWEKIDKRIVSRQMPPIEATRPEESEYVTAIADLEGLLSSRSQQHPTPGRTPSFRRLNRTEYHHAIRDLLDIDVDVDQWLPTDQASHGFDNITVVELSPTLLNRYLIAAESISHLAIGSPSRVPSGRVIRLPADQTQDGHQTGLPLGTRGGAKIEHNFPVNGRYEIQLRLTRDRDEKIEGLNGEHQIDILLDRKPMHRLTVNSPKAMGWDSGDFTNIDKDLKVQIDISAGPHDLVVTFVDKNFSIVESKRQPFEASYNRHRHPRRAPAIFEVSITGPLDEGRTGDTPSRRKIFGENLNANPSSKAPDASNSFDRARTILSRLMQQAYRRPITDDDLAVPMSFFHKASLETGFAPDVKTGFEAGIESALAAILVNPNFLFRIETDPIESLDNKLASSQVYPINDFQLATRLSFFLWSSLPDEPLMQLAEANKLRDSETLATQSRRLLSDSRSSALTENFASQWLYLRNLPSITPDLRQFPDFDNNLREAFAQETKLCFAEVVRDDRSVLELLNANYSFLNERLAKHYEIPGVVGSHFREVTLDPSQHRGGLLRHGSVLTVTSYATRTAPTIRGNWILQNILGTPPPPPPPNIPALKEEATKLATTMRQRLAEHRANPACAGCHNLMDPIGFALENFDAVGRWRDFEDEQSIDVSGILPDGQSVDGVEALEAAILERPEMFVRTLVEKLMTFALGRGIEATDGPAVRKIVDQAREDNYRFSALIDGIVHSEPFLYRMRESEMDQ